MSAQAPDLSLDEHPFFPKLELGNFGIFLSSCLASLPADACVGHGVKTLGHLGK